MIRLTDDQIWFWYCHCENHLASGYNVPEYARRYGVDYKLISGMRFRIYYKKKNNPVLYNKLETLTIQFKLSGESLGQFCKSANIKKTLMKEMNLHLSYRDIISKLKKDREPLKFTQIAHEEPVPSDSDSESLTFVQIPVPPAPTTSMISSSIHSVLEPEIIQSKNDIEIMINSGIKVILSPSVDSAKIIKIIELLKDL